MNTLTIQADNRSAPTATLQPRGPGAGLLVELVRLLVNTGRYDVTLWAEQMRAHGWLISRRQIHRWLSGAAPVTVERVEQLAIAAYVDLAYLYPDIDEPCGYVVAEAVTS